MLLPPCMPHPRQATAAFRVVEKTDRQTNGKHRWAWGYGVVGRAESRSRLHKTLQIHRETASGLNCPLASLLLGCPFLRLPGERPSCKFNLSHDTQMPVSQPSRLRCLPRLGMSTNRSARAVSRDFHVFCLTGFPPTFTASVSPPAQTAYEGVSQPQQFAFLRKKYSSCR